MSIVASNVVVKIMVGCEHPEMNMTWTHGTDEWIYWCSQCKKKITIPMYQSLLSGKDAQHNFAGIIRLTFGDLWGDRAEKGQI